MKWSVIHIVLIMLLFSSCGDESDWRFSLDKNSTEPYGLYLAYNQLDDVFPVAKKTVIYDLQKEITKQNKKAYFPDKDNLLIAITAGNYMSREEVIDLHSYVEQGGNVLILSQRFSDRFDTSFNFSIQQDLVNFTPKKKDSLTVFRNLWEGKWYQSELDMPFAKSYFKYKKGTAVTQKLVGEKYKPVILEKFIGKGKIVIGLCPELLTNYTLLKDSNIEFYEQLLSRFKRQTNKIRWYSKLSVRPDEEGGSNSNLWKLLKKKSYRYAFLVMLLMAALFFAFESRRRQRIVEVVPPVTNDSLAFTETIGKLYYGEKDNGNLARKMIQYYLEHIRTSFNLNTTHLNQELAEKLARKLNKSKEESAQFINYLNQQLTAYDLTEIEIKELYNTLKKYS